MKKGKGGGGKGGTERDFKGGREGGAAEEMEHRRVGIGEHGLLSGEGMVAGEGGGRREEGGEGAWRRARQESSKGGGEDERGVGGSRQCGKRGLQ